MNIRLNEMTRDRLHEFFNHDENQVNTYFDKHQKQGKLHFAIMLDDAVIGDKYLKKYRSSQQSQ